MKTLKINHLTVWVCIILMHGFGFLWYGPFFGERWLALIEMNQATMQADSMDPGIWIMKSVAIIASIYLIAWLFTKMDVRTGIQGAVIAFLVTFCIHHLPLMTSNMFAGEPYGLAWITGGFSLTWLTISGFILGTWVKRSN